MRRLGLLRLGAKRWRLGLVLLLIAISWAVWWTVSAPVPVPGRRLGLSAPIWPLVPALLAIGIIESASVLTEEPETLAARSLYLRRALHVVGAFVAVGLLITVLPDTDWRSIAVRNAALFLGVGYIFVSIGERTAGAVTVVLVAAVSWLRGTSGPMDPPSWWALPIHDASSRSAALVAIATAITGVAMYLSTAARPPR